MIILVTVIFCLLALSDFPPLIHQKKWREITVLSVLYVFVFTLAALQTFDVTLPSPIKGIETLIVDVWKVGYKLPSAI